MSYIERALYDELVGGMVWSYSRLKSFDDCPYRWYMRYILKCPPTEKFYASYGSFMHSLIERFYKGDLQKDDLVIEFITNFKTGVEGERPSESIVQKYIQSGIDYLSNFKEFKYPMIGVEKKVNFEIDGRKFIGYIDYLGELDGEYYIIDNKSRDLKPRSKRKNPTVSDQELDDMLKQLYIYSSAVKQEYGKLPKKLCFNCFKTGVFIEEDFNIEAYNNAINWARLQIEEISSAQNFEPRIDYFVCRYICEMSEECCYAELAKKG